MLTFHILSLSFLLTHSHRGEPYDKGLIHMVENVVIDWSRQVHDVLKKNSAQPLLEGKNPGPIVEIEFWDARRADLESVVDQLSEKKVLKMSQLLEKSLSSYYPAYRSMMDAIYNALDEARDIRYCAILGQLSRLSSPPPLIYTNLFAHTPCKKCHIFFKLF